MIKINSFKDKCYMRCIFFCFHQTDFEHLTAQEENNVTAVKTTTVFCIETINCRKYFITTNIKRNL